MGIKSPCDRNGQGERVTESEQDEQACDILDGGIFRIGWISNCKG